jgi:uncharacterized phage protein (TIGR01671 family)
MREIKFRAFNKVTNQMIDLKKITPLALDTGFNQDGIFLPFHDDWPLMQFIGHKDKNGKDVYGGDVLLCEDGQKRVVAWYDLAAAWRVGTEDDNTWYNGLGSFIPKSEVVGNIYENPELLEAK